MIPSPGMGEFFAKIRVVPFQRPRFNRRTGSVFNSSRYSAFKTQLRAMLIGKFGFPKLDCPIEINCIFTFPTPKRPKSKYPVGRPDTDNLAKVILDCGNEILWKDDSQIISVKARKQYSDTHSVYFSFVEVV